MKTLHNNYCNSKQGYLPLFLSDCLDLLDPVLTFDRLMGGIDLNKYLTDIPEYTTGRLRHNSAELIPTNIKSSNDIVRTCQLFFYKEDNTFPINLLRTGTFVSLLNNSHHTSFILC